MKNKVIKFTKNGDYILEWGKLGKGPGEFDNPSGVAVGPKGDVFVTDSGNYRVQWFDNTGKYISQWGSFGSGKGQFNWPQGIAVNSLGDIFVADTYNKRVQKFTKQTLSIFKPAFQLVQPKKK